MVFCNPRNMTKAAILPTFLLSAALFAQKGTKVEIGYTPQMRGVADRPVFGNIEIRPGLETATASKMMVTAVQDAGFSFLTPNADLTLPLPPGKTVSSNIRPLADSDLDAYSRAADHSRPLPPNRIYGLQYNMKYDVQAKSIVYLIQSFLYQKGSGSRDWLKYSNYYDGRYFEGQLAAKIREQFATTSK